MADAQRLYGLNAVVMAGASGIGEAISRTMVKHGATVLALDSGVSGIDTIYKSVRGAKGVVLPTNVVDIGKTAVEIAKNELRNIDIVINYIEFPQESPLDDSNEDGLNDLLALRSGLYQSVADAAVPELKKSPAGRIISLGFVRSVFSIDGEFGFAKSLTDLSRFSGRIATEHGADGISANYIQPGAIMTRESRPIYSSATDLRDYCIRRSAAKRLGEPVDIAKVVLFLATDDAGFVNGSGVVVDGGLAAPQ